MFIPKRILFQKNTLDYKIGRNIYDFFKTNNNIEMIQLSNNRIKDNIPGEYLYDFYREGKKTLVVGIKKGIKFQTCKPSAHYQLPLISGCTGQCEYCYLNTNLGDKPYIKINVNIEDILSQAQNYIDSRFPEKTIFEGSATSDPIPIEPYTNSLKQTIEFFSNSENGHFRFVTKYTDIDSLLHINHRNKTEIRFTLNTEKVIKNYENKTPSLEKRIDASIRLINSAYPTGFIIAPIFIYDNWKEDYFNLLLKLKKSLPKHISHPITFEIISHRYTQRAKNIIKEIFPETKLPMEEKERIFKYGQFGYGKFLYPKNEIIEIQNFFETQIKAIFNNYIIKYII
ncbi:spore photoproduct lyase [Anaerovorax odorimutans]|uniref:spore photoproduct lyase n=1 Tax=Anaerovorax odorimutans TaxID=109327 RepID=UPI00040D574F|nr:spore photoproduct lyase [Anaerovorax odorimutans]